MDRDPKRRTGQVKNIETGETIEVECSFDPFSIEDCLSKEQIEELQHELDTTDYTITFPDGSTVIIPAGSARIIK